MFIILSDRNENFGAIENRYKRILVCLFNVYTLISLSYHEKKSLARQLSPISGQHNGYVNYVIMRDIMRVIHLLSLGNLRQ